MKMYFLRVKFHFRVNCLFQQWHGFCWDIEILSLPWLHMMIFWLYMSKWDEARSIDLILVTTIKWKRKVNVQKIGFSLDQWCMLDLENYEGTFLQSRVWLANWRFGAMIITMYLNKIILYIYSFFNWSLIDL